MLKTTSKKRSKMDPQGSLLGSENGQKVHQKRGPEKASIFDPTLEAPGVRFWTTVQRFRKIRRLRKGSLLESILELFFDPKGAKEGSEKHLKIRFKNDSILEHFWDPFLGPMCAHVYEISATCVNTHDICPVCLHMLPNLTTFWYVFRGRF